jgi:RNA polymerase sigma-70 factor (ECF subfamily)
VPTSPGEFGSFEELAIPHLPALYNLACWLTGDRPSAEDLVEETFGKAAKSFPMFKQGSNLLAWMYRIMRNIYLTTPGGLKAAALLDSDTVRVVDPEVDNLPDVAPIARVNEQTLRKTLERLPTHFREIVLLSDMEEMSYKDVGMALSIPAATVMSRLLRARKAMRKMLVSVESEVHA